MVRTGRRQRGAFIVISDFRCFYVAKKHRFFRSEHHRSQGIGRMPCVGLKKSRHKTRCATPALYRTFDKQVTEWNLIFLPEMLQRRARPRSPKWLCSGIAIDHLRNEHRFPTGCRNRISASLQLGARVLWQYISTFLIDRSWQQTCIKLIEARIHQAEENWQVLRALRAGRRCTMVQVY